MPGRRNCRITVNGGYSLRYRPILIQRYCRLHQPLLLRYLQRPLVESVCSLLALIERFCRKVPLYLIAALSSCEHLVKLRSVELYAPLLGMRVLERHCEQIWGEHLMHMRGRVSRPCLVHSLRSLGFRIQRKGHNASVFISIISPVLSDGRSSRRISRPRFLPAGGRCRRLMSRNRSCWHKPRPGRKVRP